MSKKNDYLRCPDNETDVFSTPFINEKDRLKKISNSYKNVDVARAFAMYYNMELSESLKKIKQVECIPSLEIGKVYSAFVKEIGKNGIEFTFDGAKEFTIVCKESFATCLDEVNNYLLNHDNKLMFEVREKKNDVYYVSVINAYYKSWVSMINNYIDKEEFINVHINELVNGGYVGTTLITPLCELTGKNFTSRIFIPGSHIVLNIEHDFDKWVGEDVQIVPQKFVEYKKDYNNKVVENCLVGSRKRVLQIIGDNNIYELYNEFEMANKLAELVDGNKAEVPVPVYQGTVTGIINSSGKTGIFVELDDKYITGLMPVDSYDLLEYKPGDKLTVKVKEFEVKKDREPFIFSKRGNGKSKLIKTNIRAVFEKA